MHWASPNHLHLEQRHLLNALVLRWPLRSRFSHASVGVVTRWHRFPFMFVLVAGGGIVANVEMKTGCAKLHMDALNNICLRKNETKWGEDINFERISLRILNLQITSPSRCPLQILMSSCFWHLTNSNHSGVSSSLPVSLQFLTRTSRTNTNPYVRSKWLTKQTRELA